MTSPRFGLEYVESNPERERLQKVIGKIDNLTAKFLLAEAYEVSYRIFDHNLSNLNKPLALVELHPVENTSELSPLYNRIRRYVLHRVHDKTGVGLTELLSLPRELVELVFRVAEHENRSDTNTASQNLNEIEKQISKL